VVYLNELYIGLIVGDVGLLLTTGNQYFRSRFSLFILSMVVLQRPFKRRRRRAG